MEKYPKSREGVEKTISSVITAISWWMPRDAQCGRIWRSFFDLVVERRFNNGKKTIENGFEKLVEWWEFIGNGVAHVCRCKTFDYRSQCSREMWNILAIPRAEMRRIYWTRLRMFRTVAIDDGKSSFLKQSVWVCMWMLRAFVIVSCTIPSGGGKAVCAIFCTEWGHSEYRRIRG